MRFSSLTTRYSRGLPLRWPAIIGLLASTAACGEPVGPGPDPGPGDPVLASITVTPSADTLLALDDTVRLIAVARDSEGNALTAEITWSSSAEGVATVSPNGLVTAHGNGAVVVTAEVNGVRGTAALAVQQQATTVVVTPGQGALTAVGQQLQFGAAATDGNGNPVEDPPLLWLSSDPRVATVDTAGQVTAQRPGEATITAAVQGVPGHAVVSVTQTGTTLAFRVEPSAVVAGQAISPAVQVELLDEDGNLMTEATDAVTLTLNGDTGPSQLIGTATVNAVNGVATFSGLTAHLVSAAYVMSADADGYATAVSEAFAVSFADAAQLAFDGQPADATAGVTMDPIDVEIQDQFGNRVTDATETVRLTLEPGGVAVEERAAVDGVATLDVLQLERAATGFTFTATSSGLTAATSDPFTVAPAAAAQLTFETLPDAVEGADEFAVAVAVRDAFGNVVTNAAAPVDVVLNNNPAGATLSGQTTATPQNGIATFLLSVDRPEADYDMVAQSNGLLAISEGFDVDLTFVGLDVFENRTCGITVLRVAYCWGLGQPGNGTEELTSTVTLVDSDERWDAIAVGGVHTCALNEVGAAFCWGLNNAGQGGDGSTDPQLVPTPVAGGLTFTQLAAGSSFSCGITAGGQAGLAFCWGDNSFGQLGNGNAGQNASVPQSMTGDLLFTRIDAGAFHACALDANGLGYCWGANRFGELSLDPRITPESPTPVALPAFDYQYLTLGRDHTCGVRLRNQLPHCWGRGVMLGRGPDQTDSFDALIISTGFILPVELSAGEAGTCGLDQVGLAYCWGPRRSGWIGDGTTEERTLPAPVSGGHQFKIIHPGAQHVCGVTLDGVAYCWGSNSSRALGNDTSSLSTVPIRVDRAPVIPTQ